MIKVRTEVYTSKHDKVIIITSNDVSMMSVTGLIRCYVCWSNFKTKVGF